MKNKKRKYQELYKLTKEIKWKRTSKKSKNCLKDKDKEEIKQADDILSMVPKL